MKCKTMARPLRIEFEGAFIISHQEAIRETEYSLMISMIQMRDRSNKKTIYNKGLTI